MHRVQGRVKFRYDQGIPIPPFYDGSPVRLTSVGRELPGIDSSQPNVARMYDYLLGGLNNFAVDRAAADRVLAYLPQQRAAAAENRRFLGRAVRFLAAPEQGIEQFLDIGAGLPTRGSVHEVAAHEIARHASAGACVRVAYVDYDPVVVSHGKAMLAERNRSIVVQADLRDPASLLGHPEITAHLDFSRPVGLILVNVLHWLTDDDAPHDILAVLSDALAPGSFLVLTHLSTDLLSDQELESVRRAARVLEDASAQPRFRARQEILELFDGWRLVEPGLVPKREWRPDPSARAPAGPPQAFDFHWAGVARKT
jgi:SAM-dependent methyltransferase